MPRCKAVRYKLNAKRYCPRRTSVFVSWGARGRSADGNYYILLEIQLETHEYSIEVPLKEAKVLHEKLGERIKKLDKEYETS